MITEELNSYVNDHEPSEIITDSLGRWAKKTWDVEGIQIEQTFEYFCTPEEFWQDTYKHRACFNIKHSEVKEVINGN